MGHLHQHLQVVSVDQVIHSRADGGVTIELEKEIQLGTEGYTTMEIFFPQPAVDKVRKGHTAYITLWLQSVQIRRARYKRIRESSKGYQQMRQTLRQFLGKE